MWVPELTGSRPAAAVRVVPITRGRQLLALLVVERPQHAPPFSGADERELRQLAHQLSLTLPNTQLDLELRDTLEQLRAQAEELKASRARVVAAADSERRRIERDLHDGAQQLLVALAVNLSLARDVVERTPLEAVAMLDQLAVDTKDTLRELRDLAHGIYPPMLVENGLPQVLHAAVNRLGLRVMMDCRGLSRVAAESEATVYFCHLEALQNVAKHAGPNTMVDIKLRSEDGGLSFEIRDDGPGFDRETTGAGHGLTSMSDRIGAAGGTFAVTSAPGAGTVVVGTVPPA